MIKYKGEIEGFPVEVVEAMLYNQKLQGNKVDITVFERDKTRSVKLGGFNWGDTKQDLYFWWSVIYGRDFKQFYNKYPRNSDFKSNV